MKKFLVFLVLLVATSAHADLWKAEIRYSTLTPTVSTSPAYTAKDNIGGLLTFTAVCYNSTTFSVTSVQIIDKSDQAVAYDLQLFSANPSSSTFTDNAATTINTADTSKMLPVISLNSTDHFSYTGNGQSSLVSFDAAGFVTAPAGVLYGALVARGTPTYTGTSDITVRVGYRCN